MKIWGTLSIYLGKQFLKNIGIVLAILMAIIFLVDFIELLRRSTGKENITIWMLANLALLRLPNLILTLLPFVALFGSMLAFFRMSRTSELTVIRASGVSAWLFLMPALLLAFAIGVFTVGIINPIASAMSAKASQIEATQLQNRSSLLFLSSNNLWLRQTDRDGLSVIHARGAINQGIDLTDVIIFRYDLKEQFIGRIEAKRALLRSGYWELKDVLMTSPEQAAVIREEMTLKTDLTIAQIQESFSPPATLSFWELPKFIRTLEEAGFSALNHRIYWHSLIASPVLLMAMVLVAATFSLRTTRRGGGSILIMAGITSGFVFYFFTDIIRALGMSGNLPVLLAAWIPAVAIIFLGVAMMFHLEDG
ncbi:LPS export ABC transporter permease LptG [Sneathiella sp. P13V-1]|uniref:LPS export ABC transporter permease LptG n=1 Tax=Sneathiella sp. P13V-1 TaxID=2697366 RepID=UPI00187BB218|nr:LPS export ABC transporter permease LptG [Sneathiella sp. P13V-1]MBE7637014.1 LPS export ABC transporter permease LptG [Sneathiella sp. P13V-1]